MSWLPARLPEIAEHRAMRFVPLTPALVESDYAAVMRDTPMLRAWSASDWPPDDFTLEANREDLVDHDQEQRDRIALTYSVLLGGVVQGCIYVRTFSSALETRELILAPLPAPSSDVVARGWLHDRPAVDLIVAAREFLLAAPFEFPRLWWQTNTDCADQIAACDHLGLTDEIRLDGDTATWVLRSRPVATRS